MKISVDMGDMRRQIVDWKPALDAMQEALLLVRNTWERAVLGEKLPGMSQKVQRSLGEAYAQNLHRSGAIRSTDPFDGEVSTDFKYAEAIERGTGAYDMKPGLLNGPHAKIPGRLAIVPMRHGKPGAEQFKAMPKPVYNMARRLSYYQKGRGGGRLGDLSDKYPPQTKTFFAPHHETESAVHGRMMSYTHKTSIYSGMVRAGGPKYTQYLTFRAVSINSDPASWWHPAIAPNPVRDAVVQTVRRDVEQILRSGWEAAIR